jgi:Xaa-Pro aminopeptidase
METKALRDVYEAVLRVMRHANSILRPSILLPDYQKLVLAEIERELIALGLFTAEEAVAVGMVFTIEPSIYLPEEGFGIRLENNYLISENENIDLMASIPIEVDEIERLMSAVRVN